MKTQQLIRSSSLKKGEAKSSKQMNQSSSPRKNEAAKQQQRKTIVLGVCAMKKKVESKPMREILNRIQCPEIKIVEMHQYLDVSYRDWPMVDALICFYSEGFPYLKAWRYVRKNKPFLINNLDMQEYLWDRTVVYDILKKARIPVAKHYMVFNDKDYIKDIQKWCFHGQQQFEKSTKGESQLPQTPKFQSLDSKFQEMDKFLGEIKQVETFQVRVNTKKSIQVEIQKQTQKNVETNQQVDILIAQKQNQQKQKKEKENDTKEQEIEKEKLPPRMQKRLTIRKQTIDLFQSYKIQNFDRVEKNEEYKQALTAKRPMRDISSETTPCTLRKYHQSRLDQIQTLEIEQVDDQILIKGKQKVHKMKKPFVEKPFYAENHQICIYYPESMGGGRKMLFRKVKNSSSTYEANQNRIRRDGNYIYQEYLPTGAFDIKVYAIGEYYMYAEARKSPTLDGVVERDSLGKQKRFPIILTPQEKFIAKKIVHQFGQEVCGFDLLRANGKSYVCDVNGWSFVKGNPKYWTDCAKILQKKLFHRFLPHLIKQQTKFYEKFNISSDYLTPSLSNNISVIPYKLQELRSIVSVFRHGDRSPKLKLKFKTSQPKFIQLFTNQKLKQLKIKDANSLTKLLETTLQVIGDNPHMKNQDLTKLVQMKTVLQSGGHFQGLNRKCQLKVLSRDEDQKITKILIVFKWGGELSNKGSQDAIQLGKKMRMQKYNDDQDFLSLHSSYRHDLKTYSSDEGRCIKTAASFLKGFLNIQGGLAPIITSMVMTNKKAQNLLDCTSQQNHSALGQKIVKKLSDMLNSAQNLVQIYERQVDVKQISPQMIRIMKEIGVPRQKLKILHKSILQLTLLLQTVKIAQISADITDQANRASGVSDDEQKEDIILIYQRWSKLQKDFYHQQEMRFNISKIPEIYDTIRHDLSKNSLVFSTLEFDSHSFMQLAKLFAYFVVSNQYGITNEQKIMTAQQIATPLLDKVLVDLMFWKVKQYEDQYWKYQNNGAGEAWKHIRTRLYFTSASHIYSLLHLITLGNDSQLLKATPPEQVQKINKFVYMSYLSHIQFRLYENMQKKQSDPNKFRVELTIYPDFSKGQTIQEGVLGTNGFTIDQIQKFITSVKKKFSQLELNEIERTASKTNDIEQIQKKLNSQGFISIKKQKKPNKKSKQKKSKDKGKKKFKRSDSQNSKQ